MKVGPYRYATSHRGERITALTLTSGRGRLQVGQRALKSTGFEGEEIIPVRGHGTRYGPRGEVSAIKMGANKTKTGTLITLDVSFAGRIAPLRISIFDVRQLEVQ